MENSPNSPSLTSHLAARESPALDRLDPILTTTTVAVVGTEAAEGVPETLMSTPMDTDTYDIDANVTFFTESKDNPDFAQQKTSSLSQEPGHVGATSTTITKVESSEKQALSLSGTTPTPSGSKAKAPYSQFHRPQHQIAFEFSENPGMCWLFPYESSLELVVAEGSEPAKIAASFYLSAPEDPSQGMTAAGSDTTQGSVSGAGQVSTMVILDATSELWIGLQRSISDSATTYRYMMEKMRHIPPRVYVQYHLPIDFSMEQLQSLGLKKLPDHRVVPLTTLEPPKRPLESSVGNALRNVAHLK